MTPETIERVARAIAAETPGKWEEWTDDQRRFFIERAKAAIDAIRDPRFFLPIEWPEEDKT